MKIFSPIFTAIFLITSFVYGFQVCETSESSQANLMQNLKNLICALKMKLETFSQLLKEFRLAIVNRLKETRQKTSMYYQNILI